MLTAKEINDLCIKSTPAYIKILKDGIETRTPLADKLGLTKPKE